MSIGFVSASESMTEIIGNDLNEIELTDSQDHDLLKDDVKYSDIYVNSSKEVNGDGLSPETAYKSLSYDTYTNLGDNGTIHLAEGYYDIPDYKANYIIVGMGDDTVINSCWFKTSTYANDNKMITFSNLTFDIPVKREVYETVWIVPQVSFETVHEYFSISLDGTNFKFINCTFINSSIVSGQYLNSIDYQNPIMESTIKSFENCKFLNYSYNSTVKEYYKKLGYESIRHTEFEASSLITSFQYTKFIFDKCVFDNITAVCVADSRGGLMGTNGVYGEIIIQKSSFTNCNVTGIVKAQQVSDCKIEGCTYDFKATNDISGESPFYINKTDIPLNETKLTITSENNNVVITLTDVNADKPIVGVEVGIFNNGKVVDYLDTDTNGQIILKDLDGTYNFEFSYPGDPYAYLPTSVNKTFTFTKNQNTTPSKTVPATNKIVKKSTKITAKKATFKKSKKVKKYTITLKSGKNPIKKVKVYLKVKGKTYKATTNAKGKATFKITKLNKKGTYKAKITFKGNKNYKSAGKTIKIKVK